MTTKVLLYGLEDRPEVRAQLLETHDTWFSASKVERPEVVVKLAISEGATTLAVPDIGVLGDRLATVIEHMAKLASHGCRVWVADQPTFNSLALGDVRTNMKLLLTYRAQRYANRSRREARAKRPSDRQAKQDARIKALIADGETVRGISFALSVSPNTVMRVRKELDKLTLDTPH